MKLTKKTVEITEIELSDVEVGAMIMQSLKQTGVLKQNSNATVDIEKNSVTVYVERLMDEKLGTC
jgi:riboflavin synthase alpha subunit